MANNKYDSNYSIALAILEKMKGGGSSCKLQDATLAVWENGKFEINPEPGFDGLTKAYVDVNVPTSTPNLQEVSTTITTNGLTTIKADPGFDGISTANVTVAVPEPYLVPLKIDKNGVYNPEPDTDGFNSVEVNVPTPSIETVKTLDITSNGTYNITPSAGYTAIAQSTIHVNVPQGGGGSKIDVGAYHLKFSRSKAQVFPSELFDFSNVQDFGFMFNSMSDVTTIGTTENPINISNMTAANSMLQKLPSIRTIEFTLNKGVSMLGRTVDVTKIVDTTTAKGTVIFHTYNGMPASQLYQPIYDVLQENGWTIQEVSDIV